MDAADEILAAERPAFARAVRAIITGDVDALRAELAAAPDLPQARSGSLHRATLLHYVAANGIEDALQRPVAVADEIARVLIAAGAAVDGLGGDRLPLSTALLFGRVECVDALIACGARTDNPVFAAAGGAVAWIERWLAGDPGLAIARCPTFPLDDDPGILAEQALVFASMCGRLDIVRLLLDRGTRIDATPPGSHWTATALHTAAGQGHRAIVELLVERGADPSIKDVRYQSTPLGWATYMGRDDVVAVLSELSL